MQTNFPEQPPVYASLDLGSNSFHLLLARFDAGKLLVVDRHKENVRLAEGLDSEGFLSDEAVERALASLRRFAERLRSTPLSHFRVVGTNTLRAAKNADHFLQQAEAILRVPIRIISGSEEARLIYLGVAGDFAPQPGHRRLVVDIGGGSTELVVGEKQPERLESLYLGCINTSQRYFPNGELSARKYQRALLGARNEVQAAIAQFGAGNWDEAVGSSGTVRALETLLEAMSLNHEHTISLQGLEALAKDLERFKTVAEIDWPGLKDERRSVIAGGLAVLHAVFIELGVERMHVSASSLREGVLLDLLGGPDGDARTETVQRMMRQYRVDVAQVNRLQDFATGLMEQLQSDFGSAYERLALLLRWAISLHEIGLALAHSGYHKHGAYLLLHSDMPGFSKQEQKVLSFLVLNHRRRLRSVPATYGFEPDWRLVQILRLVCLFGRRRHDSALPKDIKVALKEDGIRIWLDPQWLEEHPLTEESLRAEQRYLKAINFRLDLKALT